jgi:hypothetical protein
VDIQSEQPAPKRLSQAAIGRAMGLSKAAITKLKYQGMPVDSVESALQWRKANQNIAARKGLPMGARAFPDGSGYVIDNAGMQPGADAAFGGGSDAFGESHEAARTRREISEANLAEMRESEMRGELIRLDSVRSALAGVISSTRDSLLQLPARLAPVLAAETDAARVNDLIQAEIHQALAQIVSANSKLHSKEGNA